jgi:hypothetical protein
MKKPAAPASRSVLSRLASTQNRRVQAPNVALAKALAAARDTVGIREVAESLLNKDGQVAADCIKVLYEIGAVEPALIAGYGADFIKLLGSKNNRLVWGGMTALAAIAPLSAAELFKQWLVLRDATEGGSVITADNGILTLARLAATSPARRKAILPYLLEHLGACRPKEVPQRAEKIAAAVDAGNRAAFVAVLEKRRGDLSAAQAARVKKIIRNVTG